MTSAPLAVAVIADESCHLGEGPLWHAPQNGDLWVAMVLVGRIIRYGLDGAERQRIQMPTTFTTSLTFGGKEFRRIFVVTGMAHERDKFGPAGPPLSSKPALSADRNSSRKIGIA